MVAAPPLAAACRPRQWTKNLLVFAGPLFAFRFEAAVWLPAAGALVAFCLISSAIYLLNDCLDVAADRAHPSKRHRPIAAGLVSVPAALTTALLLALASLTLAAWVAPALAGVVLLYGLIQVGYCLQFKRMPLLDLFCIASGFLLRAIAGAVAAIRHPCHQGSMPALCEYSLQAKRSSGPVFFDFVEVIESSTVRLTASRSITQEFQTNA